MNLAELTAKADKYETVLNEQCPHDEDRRELNKCASRSLMSTIVAFLMSDLSDEQKCSDLLEALKSEDLEISTDFVNILQECATLVQNKPDSLESLLIPPQEFIEGCRALTCILAIQHMPFHKFGTGGAGITTVISAN